MTNKFEDNLLDTLKNEYPAARKQGKTAHNRRSITRKTAAFLAVAALTAGVAGSFNNIQPSSNTTTSSIAQGAVDSQVPAKQIDFTDGKAVLAASQDAVSKQAMIKHEVTINRETNEKWETWADPINGTYKDISYDANGKATFESIITKELYIMIDHENKKYSKTPTPKESLGYIYEDRSLNELIETLNSFSSQAEEANTTVTSSSNEVSPQKQETTTTVPAITLDPKITLAPSPKVDFVGEETIDGKAVLHYAIVRPADGRSLESVTNYWVEKDSLYFVKQTEVIDNELYTEKNVEFLDQTPENAEMAKPKSSIPNNYTEFNN